MGIAIFRSIDEDPKIISMAEARRKFRIGGDVAKEVNDIMLAWEHGGPEARKIFLQQVSGQKVVA